MISRPFSPAHPNFREDFGSLQPLRHAKRGMALAWAMAKVASPQSLTPPTGRRLQKSSPDLLLLLLILLLILFPFPIPPIRRLSPAPSFEMFST
jgi:hypothetical protein